MLPVNRWKLDVILRFILSVFLCVYAGAVLARVWGYAGSPGEPSLSLVYSASALALALSGLTLWLVWRPWSLDHVFRQLAVILGLFYSALIAGAWAQKLAGTELATAGQVSVGALCFQGGILALMPKVLHEHQQTWAGAFGLGQNRRRALVTGCVVAFIFLPVAWGLQQTSAFVFSYFSGLGLKPEEQQAVQVLRTAASVADQLKMALVTILLAPAAEEILFRGILFSWIRQVGYPRLALWGTALLFAFAHYNLVTFMPLLVLALVLALIYERTGNLLAPVAAHSTFNALNFVVLFLTKNSVG